MCSPLSTARRSLEEPISNSDNNPCRTVRVWFVLQRAGTPTRSHTSLVSAPPQSTRVNQPTFFMRIGAPPEPPLSKAYLSTRAAERSPLGDAPQAQQNSKKLG
eukprot:Opistho-2@43861